MSNHYNCQRLTYAQRATAPFSPIKYDASATPTLPSIQTLFPEAKWNLSSPPPPPMFTLPGLFSRCWSPPAYPYQKCVLDVAMTPTKTTLKRLEMPMTKPRKPLSLFDLLSVDAALTAAEKKFKPSAHHRRQCGVIDCAKYALSGGFCIRHGGGKRCNFDGCQTVAQSGGLCKAHGGGSKCKVVNCSNVARRKGFCMTHGGRQPCKVDGCAKCAHGGGFCISHGGGKRCASLECVKSAQAGGFCYSHGGGKRCSAPQCFQAARKGGLCIRHRKAFSTPTTAAFDKEMLKL